MSNEKVVRDGLVVSMEYTLHVDGELLDSSEGQAPLEFLQGYGNIIPGLEKELTGMAVGESKKVTVSPEDGYGVFDEDAFIEVPRNQFPDDIPMEEGIEIHVHDNEGREMTAHIDEFTEETVRLNFNHPLAGEELVFNVKIVGVREPTEEELDHGHVHGTHGHD